MAINPNQLRDAFNRALGREPRQDELDFFVKSAQDNDLSEYEIGEILSGSPEAQRSQATRDVSAYSETLGKYDQEFLGKASSELEAKFRGQGRSASGSAYAAAFAATAQKLAQARQGQLADLYQSRLNAAAGGEASRSSGLRQRGYDLADDRTARARDLEDFYMGRDAANSQMNQINRMRRNQAFGQLGGAAIGGVFGGLPGAQVGSQIGGGLGGLFG